MERLYKKILEIAPNSKVTQNEPMSRHTSFKIGGPADIFVDVSPEELPQILAVANDENAPITVVGNGSNLLVGDGGIRGVVLCFASNAKGIEVSDNEIIVGAGELLSVVSKTAADNSLSRLEFAAGIPGSVGGACVMNAGAYGGQMSDCIDEVFCVDVKDGSERIFAGPECDLSYRHSIFLDSDYIITKVKLRLSKGEKSKIYAKMEEYNKSRKEKQPIEYPSAGSTFKRPEGYFAGKLIMDADLKGFSVGDAQVSEKHAGFIINVGNATAGDVRSLIDLVKKRVYDRFGVQLVPEVRFVGDFK